MNEHASSGIVYDIQRYSINDGPGIRTTVFLKGCPLRCPWCHAPESQAFAPQVSIKKVSCRSLASCGYCLEVCPQKAISESEYSKIVDGQTTEIAIPFIDIDICNSCFKCAEVCPTKALSVCGEEKSVDQIISIVNKDSKYYKKTGGGITVSGGEALCQSEFVTSLLRAAKNEGLNTALDTSGYIKAEALEGVLPYVDLFLYDIKHTDSHLHKQVVGVKNELILENIKMLAKRDASIWIRIPLIPKFNDSKEVFSEYLSIIKELGNSVKLVQILPYHPLGISKYETIFWKKPVFEAKELESSEIQKLAEYLINDGIPTKIH